METGKRALRWLGGVPAPVAVLVYFGAWAVALALKDARIHGGSVVAFAALGLFALYAFARGSLGWDTFSVGNWPFVVWALLDSIGVDAPAWFPFALLPLVLGYVVVRERRGVEDDDEDGPSWRRA